MGTRSSIDLGSIIWKVDIGWPERTWCDTESTSISYCSPGSKLSKINSLSLMSGISVQDLGCLDWGSGRYLKIKSFQIYNYHFQIILYISEKYYKLHHITPFSKKKFYSFSLTTFWWHPLAHLQSFYIILDNVAGVEAVKWLQPFQGHLVPWKLFNWQVSWRIRVNSSEWFMWFTKEAMTQSKQLNNIACARIKFIQSHSFLRGIHVDTSTCVISHISYYIFFLLRSNIRFPGNI